MAELSPMMRQYMEIKSQNENSILFFRLGDFYEMFYEDAKVASEELDLTLTGKECGQPERAPMCGVPYHSCEAYISRLVERGYKVAVCEQMEDPSTAKGIVKREVVKIITPGTVSDYTMLDESKNNYLCSLSEQNGEFGICFVDASTGEANLTEIKGDETVKKVIDEIGRFSPREIIAPSTVHRFPEIVSFITDRLNASLTVRADESFDVRNTEGIITKQLGIISVETLGILKEGLSASVLGAAVEYLAETGVSGDTAVKKVSVYTQDQFMRLDLTAIRNLEIVETMRQKSKRGSLLWVLDKTKTAMGKRLIRAWAEKPLMNVAEISLRQNGVEELMSDAFKHGETVAALSCVRDIERLITRTVYGTANARDLRALCDTLKNIPALKKQLADAESRILKSINEQLDELADIRDMIESAIVDEPPISVREGGLIRDDYNLELKDLKDIVANSTAYITRMEENERERTGIKNLRIRYNRVFGYYIEVTNSFLDKVPDDYIRKQTLTNCERYITENLKHEESKILGAREKSVALEYEIFSNLRKRTAEHITRFQSTAAAIAKLDVLSSFATVAVENSYCRPLVDNSGIIKIKNGRHPVVEKVIKSPFVSNDTYLETSGDRCAVITGPNMAGKSTYMRQVALITVMAQMGSFVPAESAQIGVVDAIFTRVGASDDLASGQSTFMVEMNEVANIIKNATRNSLLILDEIGRGTSTFDGMAIARAVLEFVANKKTLGAKSLFATHYHELTQLENEMSGIVNYNIAVKKRGDDIIFLRRIVRGGADESYGIEVAKLSGIPESVISRAKVILKEVLQDGVTVYKNVVSEPQSQMSLGNLAAEEIYAELKNLDVNTLTPIESVKILYDLSERAKSL